MAMGANDRMELWTVGLQVIILSIGFALILLWNEDSIPKALVAINLILLVLIYPMPDRVKNSLQKEIVELHKAHGVTQGMILELREAIPNKVDLESLSSNEQLAKAQEVAKKLDTFRSEFGKSFDESFQDERIITGADRVQFLADTIGTTVYLAGLIGASAILGWFISSFF